LPEPHRNILFITTAFPHDNKPFDGIFVYRHARAISNAGENVIVLTAEDTDISTNGFTIKNSSKGEIKVFRAKYKTSFGPLNLNKKVDALKQGFKEIAKTIKIDLVHVHFSYPAGFAALWIKKNFNIPYVITEHSSMFNSYRKELRFKVLRKLIKPVLEGAEMIMPVSEDLSKHMKAISQASSYRVVPNVVDANTFKLKDSPPSNSVRILHVSSLTEPKNVPGLLQVIKNILEQKPDIQFTIVGEYREDHIEKQIKDLGVSKNQIELLFGLSELEIAKQMQIHDAFLLFSNYENLPCVLIEAQSCGLPILSTNVGGIAEIVNSDALGVLVERGDITSMVNHISNFSPQQYDKSHISETGQNRYRDEVVAEQFRSIYRQVLS